MRLVDLFVRLGADTSGMERGMAGAQKALAGFERASTTAGVGSDKFNDKLSVQDQQLRQVATDLARTGGAMNDLHKRVIEGAGGMEKYNAIVAAMNGGAARTAQVIEVQASAFGQLDVQAGKGRLAVGRLSTQFGSLAASAAGVHPVLTNLAGVLGGFAVGGFVTAGVLAGLAALAVAYRRFTSESREAQKAAEDFSKALQDQAKSARLATVAGQQGLKILAENDMDRAQAALLRAQAGRTVFDPATGGLTKRIVDTQAVAAAQRAYNIALENFTTQSKNVEDAIEAADDASGEYGETLNSLAGQQDRAATAATKHADALLGLAAALRGMPSIDAAAALGAGATAAFDIERARREREFAPGSESFKRTVSESERSRQFADTLARRALNPMIDEKEKPGLELGKDVDLSGRRQVSKLDEVKAAIFSQTNILSAATMALGDRILVGGGGAGSRTGAFIGGSLLGAIGIGGGPLGKAFGSIVGTMAGSLFGGLFDKGKEVDQATDSLERFRRELNRITAGLFNVPDAFKRSAWVDRFTDPTILLPRPPIPGEPGDGGTGIPGVPGPGGPGLPGVPSPSILITGTVVLEGVQTTSKLYSELERYAASRTASGNSTGFLLAGA